MPRLGMRMILKGDYDQMTWLGEVRRRTMPTVRAVTSSVSILPAYGAIIIHM